MCNFIPIIFYLFILLRLTSLLVSFLNERQLKSEGALEFGKKNTVYLITAHILYYFFCIAEGYHSSIFTCDWISIVGGCLLLFSIVSLFMVIFSLGKIWTMKLIILKSSSYVHRKNLIFKIVKHPRYYLNIIPELIGLAVFLHAPYNLLISFPLYLIPLIIRIRQEKQLRKQYFSTY